ncbi:MAG: hypothetical protein Q8Q89_00450 [bacterium]|nr:hypothetical protein [bacterium]
MIKKFKIKNLKFGKIYEKGQLSIFVLIFSSIAMITFSGLIIWVDSSQRAAVRTSDQKLALMIAEAGAEYYRWHLAHAPQDFKDGTGQPGPYTHNYYDKSGNLIGKFILEITPPEVNGYIVTIRSTGKVENNPSVEKIIEARLGIPSVIKYAVLSNSDIRFELGTQVYGPVHSNGGVRFDGKAYNLVTSGRTKYNDPDHAGNDEYGVHTHVAPVDPEPPAPLPVRSDVFAAGRDLPVPLVDFNGLTETLAQIKSKAQSGGKYFGSSGSKGYHIVLKTNDTFDIYKVKKETKKPDKSCKNTLKQKNWKTWSIRNAVGSEQLIGNYPIPANGLIFVEDNVWVDGKIDTAKLTIAAGRFPFNPKKYKHIIINKDLIYTNYDGRDVIGLIAQGHINIGMDSEDDIRIDAAAVAQNGHVARYYYRPPFGSKPGCSSYQNRQNLVFNGMIATNKGYGFAYTDGSGYQNRTISYDSNLLYNPPPSFPLVSSFYEQVSWREIK